MQKSLDVWIANFGHGAMLAHHQGRICSAMRCRHLPKRGPCHERAMLPRAMNWQNDAKWLWYMLDLKTHIWLFRSLWIFRTSFCLWNFRLAAFPVSDCSADKPWQTQRDVLETDRRLEHHDWQGEFQSIEQLLLQSQLKWKNLRDAAVRNDQKWDHS